MTMKSMDGTMAQPISSSKLTQRIHYQRKAETSAIILANVI